MSYNSLEDLESSIWELEAHDDESFEATVPIVHRRARVTQMYDELVSRTPPSYHLWPSRMNNYGAWLLKQYRRSNMLGDLTNAISKVSAAAQAASDDHPSKARISTNLSSLYTMQHTRTLSPNDLDSAIDAAKMAVSLIETDRALDRTVVFTLLVVSLTTRYQLKEQEDDIRHAIALGDEVVRFTPARHPERAQILTNLVLATILLYMRTKVQPETERLSHLIMLAEEAIDRTTEGDPALKRRLLNLAIWLSLRAERDDNIEDIDRLIGVVEQQLSFPSTDSFKRVEQLAYLANMYWSRYKKAKLPGDCDRSIETLERAVKMANIARDQRTELSLLTSLRTRLLLGNRLTERCEDLEKAIIITQKIASSTQDVSRWIEEMSRQLSVQMELGKCYEKRFSTSKYLKDIDRAIKVGCEMCRVELRKRLLSGKLSMTKMSEGVVSEAPVPAFGQLNQTVDLGNETLSSPGETLLASQYVNNPLLLRRLESESFDALSDEEILDGSAHFDGVDPLIIAALGLWLGQKATYTGDRIDLNRSIRILTTAIEIGQVPNYANIYANDYAAGMMSNLAGCYKSRSVHTGALSDIESAVRWSEKAVELSTSTTGHELGILGICYGARGDWTRSVDDLNLAIIVTEKAIELCSTNFMKAHHLANVGNYLHKMCMLDPTFESREKSSTIEANLDKAIRSARQAIELLAQDHQESVGVIFSLANLHSSRYQRNGVQDDLEMSITLNCQGLSVLPDAHAERAPQLLNLAWNLQLRFGIGEHPEDKARAIETYQEATSHPQSTVSSRIYSARLGAAFLSSQSQWKDAYQLCGSAINLLPQLDLRILSNADRLRVLKNFQGLSSIATAVALNTSCDDDEDADTYVSEALKALEQGRGLISSMILDARTDISMLKKQHSVLAIQFDSVRTELQSTASQPTGFKTVLEGPFDTAANQRRNDLCDSFNRILGNIRQLPGFEQFMLPLPATELREALKDLNGSVVMINVNRYRCDAFLLRHGLFSLFPLPALNIDDVSRWAGRLTQSRTKDGESSPLNNTMAMTEMLQWLWDALACPILDKLGYIKTPVGNNWPRIWWIPTGVLSNLPLHAAGRHIDDSNDNVMDRAISSYSSSIKALMPEFHGALPVSKSWTSKKVTLSEVNDGLPFVKDEAERLTKLWRTKGLEVVTSTQRSVVLSHIKQCTFFHFAGHGSTNARDPSKSFLQLGRGPESMLTVNDLQEETAGEHKPFMAYLSACSTGANHAKQLADESIHLIGAAQLAGFRHVIGTLWEVSDEYCPEVAQETYRTILHQDMTDGFVSRGLHGALRCLRKKMMRLTGELQEQRDATIKFASKSPTQPHTSGAEMYTWVPYVHYGI